MERNRRRVEKGVVVSDSSDKTITVLVENKIQHPVYKKRINRSKKYKAHDENNEAKVGDTVVIMETRPLSKTKRWRLVRIDQAAEII
ncbi:MAG: 30S ribosomal protein S17 [Anaerococcus sp.]|nr:30S ribosomal protein S17 [Anaerococcus sp.]MDD7044039.1 30S ribosomal protein S17 [Peptoniphilaceae bacterium]MDY2919147.1 30S ribosomal protein S17 [Anaerococcus sp.]